MWEENLHAGGKWETMNFLGVALIYTIRGKIVITVYSYACSEMVCHLIVKCVTTHQMNGSTLMCLPPPPLLGS